MTEVPFIRLPDLRRQAPGGLHYVIQTSGLFPGPAVAVASRDLDSFEQRTQARHERRFVVVERDARVGELPCGDDGTRLVE